MLHFFNLIGLEQKEAEGLRAYDSSYCRAEYVFIKWRFCYSVDKVVS